MKNLYTTIVFLSIAIGAFAQYGQFPNGGFENWTDQDLYDYPTDWQNSNVNEPNGIPTITQSNDAQDGSHSCEIFATTTGAQDTIFGYVYHGVLGPLGPSNGISYTSNIDEIQYQYKCDLAAGDTLFIIAARFISGVLVGTDVVEAAVGTQNAWTAGSVSLSNGAQDELFLGFVMNNPFGSASPNPGSWARIDNVSMHNAGIEMTNVPDPSFENWSTETTENPDDWYTINYILAPFNAENAVKTTDANSGTYAIEMSTVQPFAGGDTIASFLSFGAIDLSSLNPFSAAPYDATPDSLIGAYKYTPANGDQAFMTVLFYQAGSIIGSVNHMFNTSPTWDTFEVPLSIIGTPDSLAIIAYSGDNPGSVLHLDDLMFLGGNVGLDEFHSLDVAIYPNPASTSVMIKAEGNYNYSIVDLSGNVVMNAFNQTGVVELDITELSSGAYFVNITNDLRSESRKLIIE